MKKLKTKEEVMEVFDSIADRKSWENLYQGKMDRLTYNFVSRQKSVEHLLTPYVKGKILDLGCGTGDLLPFFVKFSGIQYTGMDLSANMIKRANEVHQSSLKKLNQAVSAKFIVGDSEKLPFEDHSFDIISAVALIEYFPDPQKVLSEMIRVLKSAGTLLLTVPHKSCINFKIRDILEPVRNLLFPLYEKWKGKNLSEMKNVKHYHYDPVELDEKLYQFGFKKTAFEFSNFYAIPHPVDHLIPTVYMKLSEIIAQKKRPERFSFLAANYNVIYRKC